MSVRLFHRGARLVVALPGFHSPRLWIALHTRRVAWERIFPPALALVALRCEGTGEALRFAGGTLHWTAGPFWTTIRLQLPPCSAKKAALLAGGLLKAARYAEERQS